MTPAPAAMTTKVRRLTILTMSAATLLAASAVSAYAAPQPYVPSGTAPMRVTTQSAPVRTQVLNLAKGRSAVIDLPADASDVFVSNPAVADAVLRTPRRIFVLGVAPGQSDAIFFDGMGRQILNLSVRVEAATDNVADAIHRLFPQSQVEVQSLNGHIVLSGMAQNAGDADQIARLAQTYVDKPENVLNLISIAGKDQVTLKVRIVEVNRNTVKQIGLGTDIAYNVGNRQYSFLHKTSYDVAGKYSGTTEACYDQVGASGAGTTLGKGTNNTGCLEAFEQVGLARTLAEPNLTAVSGESAKFLAGGEFPVPVGQDNQGRVTVEFKPFGVGLGFTPVVLSGGRISLRISTEVSELTNIGALSLSSTLTIPGLTVRRAETSVEMQSGSSLMIGGLLEAKSKQVLDSLPGLSTLPVIGSLFRSRDFLNDETEMVVIVTPYLSSATNPDALQTPADNLELANDMSAVFMGNLNKVIHKTPDNQAASAPPPYRAPIGYVIE